MLTNGFVLKWNSKGKHCFECDFYSKTKGCKLNKVNPIQEHLALQAYHSGKLCKKGKWIITKEV